MKITRLKSFCLITVMSFLVVTVVNCGGGSLRLPTANTIAVPSLADIRTALGENNAYGMVPTLALGEITLPACTKEDGSAIDYDVTYSIDGLPTWLTFDATTRAITLADDATVVPASGNTAASITYTCVDDSDATVTASTDAFTINDLDGGGVLDGLEYANGAIPLLDPTKYISLTPGDLNLNRIGTSSFLIPTSVYKPTVGMDPTDPDDDTADFDGDAGVTGGGTNTEEITAGTNVFVYAATAAFTASAETYSGDLSQPGSGLIVDLNGDGVADFSIIDGTSVVILLGDGDGTFTDSGENPSTGSGPIGITSADFNGDGYYDLAVSNSDDNNLTILLNDGDGTFTDSGANPTTGTTPYAISTADFNGDGIADLVSPNYSDDDVSIFLGVGNGTFGSKTDYATGVGPVIPAAADFDGDGDIDIAVGNLDANSVSILLGSGDGTFAAKADYTTGAFPISVNVADFDNDGNIDIALANNADASVSILLGIGDGTFAAKVDYTVGAGPRVATTADLDGDGDIDIATANDADDDVTILLGDGDGTFTDSGSTISVGDTPLGCVAGDLDSDGALDLITPNEGDASKNITVLIHQ